MCEYHFQIALQAIERVVSGVSWDWGRSLGGGGGGVGGDSESGILPD